MPQDGRVVDHSHAAVGRLGEGLLYVAIAGEVVLGVVDGSVVHAARPGYEALELRAAGSVAPLLLAAHKVVRVVAGEVGAKGGAEIGVLIVVALHVERLGAAAALRHAVVDEVIQGLIFASVCPFVNIWILIEIVVGIENRRIIKPRRFGELRDDGIRISFSKTFTPGITKVLVRIAPIGDKSVFNQNTGDSSFTSTTNNSKFIAHLHLKDTTVCKSESYKIVLNLLGQFV